MTLVGCLTAVHANPTPPIYAPDTSTPIPTSDAWLGRWDLEAVQRICIIRYSWTYYQANYCEVDSRSKVPLEDPVLGSDLAGDPITRANHRYSPNVKLLPPRITARCAPVVGVYAAYHHFKSHAKERYLSSLLIACRVICHQARPVICILL